MRFLTDMSYYSRKISMTVVRNNQYRRNIESNIAKNIGYYKDEESKYINEYTTNRKGYIYE